LQSDCYKKTEHPNPYDYSDNGDHSCYQSSRVPNNPNIGADTGRIIGYKWNPHAHHGQGQFVQIPLQVDEVFTRYITNNVSGFAFYSGVDKETSYVWDREGFRFTRDAYLDHGGDPCIAMPVPAADGTTPVTTPDPVRGLDDNDEIAFMWSDAGTAAPSGAARPAGIKDFFDVTLVDPADPGAVRHAYLGLSTGDPDAPTPKFDVTNGYVRYERDPGVRDPSDPAKWLTPPADMLAFSESSNDGYGAAPKGPYCRLDGTISTTYHSGNGPPSAPPAPNGWAIEQRRPLDTAWVKTDRYAFRYDGRWLMTQLRVSPGGKGLASNDYGPDIIDQWKARAFQQRPGGKTPCCGYEEEVNNWGGSSILFGERIGPVRAIRAAWGADSSTNNIKTEIFYADEIRFLDNLRVHVIPPFDGIYVQWDYSAEKVSTYYNPWKSDGVPADGVNDEVFGNTRVHIASDGVSFYDGDGDGTQIGTPGAGNDQQNCSLGARNGVCNDLDFADPTFSGPVGNLNWEEVAGPYGSVVTRWGIKKHTAGDAFSILAQPYYRDDSCFDDGTGTSPGPHLNSRKPDSGEFSTYVDPISGETKPRECWGQAGPWGAAYTGDPEDLLANPAGPRRFWQGDVATHGLHIQLIADSDNAQLTEPVDEMDSEQRMVVLPGNPGNVGDRYGRSAEFPLQVLITPYID
jgi:hypothetical protein